MRYIYIYKVMVTCCKTKLELRPKVKPLQYKRKKKNQNVVKQTLRNYLILHFEAWLSVATERWKQKGVECYWKQKLIKPFCIHPSNYSSKKMHPVKAEFLYQTSHYFQTSAVNAIHLWYLPLIQNSVPLYLCRYSSKTSFQ